MLTINKNILEYSCDISYVCDNLLLDTSYESSDNNNGIICEDKRYFVLNRLEKVLHSVANIFGDAYVASSLYVDENNVCGFSVSISDRVISDALDKSEPLDIMINNYIISYVKYEWHELLGVKTNNKPSIDDLWKNINSLFSYKSSKSYVVEEV